MHCLNNKGRTLVEMLVVLIILGVISSIAYPMLFMNEKITNREIKESAKRNDIRSIESFLKDDLRNCSSFNSGEPEDGYLYRVSLSSFDQVEYIKNQDDKGSYYISRSRGSEKIDFRDIKNIELISSENNKLIDVKIFTTNNNEGEYLHELKVARWEWEVMKSGGSEEIYDFILNENLYIMGSGFWFAGNSVEGPGATILLRKDLLPGDFNGAAKINVSNIFIEGDIGDFDEKGDPTAPIAQSVVIGSQVNPGDIIIDGNVFLAGSARIYGNNVYISGNVNLSASGAIIANNIYIRGNLEIIGGGNEKIVDKVYLEGTYTSSGYSFVPNFQEGEVLFPGVPEFGLPKPRSSDWYLANGYTKNGVLANNAKIFSDSTSTYNLGVAGRNYYNVVVVSINGDINIDIGNWGGDASQISGVFYAPNGKITIKGKSLEGLVIARDGLVYSNGGTTMKFVGLDEYTGTDKIFASANDYPFLNEMY